MALRPPVHLALRRQAVGECGSRCAKCGFACSIETADVVAWCDAPPLRVAHLVCLCPRCSLRADREDWGPRTLRWFKRHPFVARKGSGAARKPDELQHVLLSTATFTDGDEASHTLLAQNLARFLEIPWSAVSVLSARNRDRTRVTVRLPAEHAERLLSSYEAFDLELVRHAAPWRLLDEYWPPDDEVQFIRGDAFIQMLDVLCFDLLKDFQSDFTRALARLIDRFDNQLRDDADYLKKHFPERNSLYVHLQQALVRGALQIEQSGQRRGQASALPANRDHQLQLIESLKDRCKEVFWEIAFEGKDPAFLASLYGLSVEQVWDFYQKAIDDLENNGF